ncbi:hypothetical protein, conserved [Leishmania donovani]|uniref:Uncharacterized protein n=1 Tax=Leishmania donovani TaxID=5661 RepID=E9BF64_LEIDO|nr:hypothetical protein, conserved [Leishmania donovani]AYU78539.1 hypothetical protein LdCL_210012800 [Leishmania donovani]CBZ33890.1 hypothetical protein, conserved [Leishmania donovani]
MHATYLQRVTRHFCEDKGKEFDIAAEVRHAGQATDVRHLVPLTKAGIQHFSTFLPPVRSKDDLDTLPERLKGSEELGFSPLFDPSLIDACCQRGIFPLAIAIDDNSFLFAPKLHAERAVCALAEGAAQRNTMDGFPFCEGDEGIFDKDCLGVSRKLTKAPNESTRCPSFDIFINRKEDLVDVFTLIRRQHGENWLCAPLRVCLLHMFFNPTKYATKIIVTAVRHRQYSNVPISGNSPVIQEGELVACEVGYLVGDIYASATGAYCISGGGSLQLSLTGVCMKSAGCRLWDLGMMLRYKKSLQCVSLPRKKWQKMVSARRSIPNEHILNYLRDLEKGRPVSDFLKSDVPPAIADPNSKSQHKKRLKKEAAIQRKAERRRLDL